MRTEEICFCSLFLERPGEFLDTHSELAEKALDGDTKARGENEERYCNRKNNKNNIFFVARPGEFLDTDNKQTEENQGW